MKPEEQQPPPSEPSTLEFPAEVIKLQRRPCWTFAIELAAAEFATLQPGQAVTIDLGWFLVSSTRIGPEIVRVRGFGCPKIAAGAGVNVRVLGLKRPK
ncbi:MAG TPA: hypothetical protein VGD78_06710 [Chthoniobacterales bacterium]